MSVPIAPPEPSPPGVMHSRHGHEVWPPMGTSSPCRFIAQGSSGAATGLGPRAVSVRPPRKRPRLARWNAAPYLPRRSLEAMATGQGASPRYGDEGTADVILMLRPLQGPPLPPLLLHSQALRRSEFFEARLSERWSVMSQGQPLEITLDKCVNPSTYVRCLQLLYVPNRIKHTAFDDVQDALGILEVAAELLFHDCVGACMRYLEAVPWTVENETAIRECVASLHLQSSPDLAARLCAPEGAMRKPVDVMKDVLGELLALVTNGAPSKARDITERVLLANVHPSASSAFGGVNELALLKEFQGNLGQLKSQLRKFANFFSWNAHQVTLACSALRWLIDELFSLQIADMSIKIFSEEQELAQLMVSRVYQNPFTETLFQILVRMLQALHKGEVIAPRSVRLALISTWLPIIAKLGNDHNDNFGRTYEIRRNVELSFGAVVETLPMLDQEAVFKIWVGACLKCRKAWPDLSDAFDAWCSKLRAAQRESDLELGTAPLISEVCSS
uniref:At3g05675-like ankyrin-like domain-containing protein n=2 Tax=Physcomitrium patens TaxID=3218 RepID=A0A2K1IJG4_PHYPA|nr:hypothetical protein PHYPA_028113 [Physcomitrium patens]